MDAEEIVPKIDKLGREIKAGDFISYPDSNYTKIRIVYVSKITPKTFRYMYKTYRVLETTAGRPEQAIVLNDILSDEQKQKILDDIGM